MRTALILLAIGLVVPACGKGEEAPAPTPPPAAVAPAAQANAAPAAKPATLEGTVAERVDASQYSYLKLTTTDGEVWAAVPQANIENGAKVTVLEPMLMTNFESKALGRTFEKVYFGRLTDQADPMAGKGMMAGKNPHGAMGGDPHGGAMPGNPAGAGAVDDAMAAHSKPATVVADVKVEKAPGGLDIGEVWAQRAELAGKPVTIRGKVVKYNANILGKNWIHIQDGSGDPAAATHDLTITSKDTATVGDVVTITGTLQVDQDFGAGYAYKTIVQDATITQ
ncbi:MAG: nucleotide-binding protein [Deltaproteobacteria bacterium]|nr:MAG: nucleotide-binding protein [Deltaproteobacteria bacterium]